MVHTATTSWAAYRQPIAGFVAGSKISMSTWAWQSSGNWSFLLESYNSSGTRTVVKTQALTSTGTYIKFENLTIPSDAVTLYYSFWGQTAGTLVFSQPMLVFASTVGTYVQGNYNNNAALAQVKITAEDISNFVKDANGNLSSTFQNALSKTSIITGSTLATSIQKQTATQITQAVTDNNGKIISLINQDASGVQISGSKIILDGSVIVTEDFFARGAYFKNLNASNIVSGTIDAAQINVINLDVSHLTGNITNFIQSNWNGVYGSTVITSTGMKITSGQSITEFLQNGINFRVLTTQTSGAQVAELVGGLRTGIASNNTSTNALMLVLNDRTYNSVGSPSGDTWGGDKIGFGIVSNLNGSWVDLFSWQNPTAANGSGKQGFNFYNGKINFNGNEIDITGSTNNLVFGWASWSTWFNGEKNPTIQAANNAWRGAGLAFASTNVLVFANGGGSKLLL